MNCSNFRGECDESGFTLVELILAIAISFIIVGPITGAIIIGLRTTDSSSQRLSQTRDIELVQGTLPRDVLSATSIQANVPAASTCSGKASLLKMTWSTPTLIGAGGGGPPSTTLQTYEVDYFYSLNPITPSVPQTGSLTRQLYTTSPSCAPVLGSTTILATSLSSNAALQTAVVSGGSVLLTLTDSSCARFAASAQERATTATTAPTTTTATTLPVCTG